jgi:hypothetical protein
VNAGQRLRVVTERVGLDGRQCGAKRLAGVDGIRRIGNPLSSQPRLLFLRRLDWALAWDLEGSPTTPINSRKTLANSNKYMLAIASCARRSSVRPHGRHAKNENYLIRTMLVDSMKGMTMTTFRKQRTPRV